MTIEQKIKATEELTTLLLHERIDDEDWPDKHYIFRGSPRGNGSIWEIHIETNDILGNGIRLTDLYASDGTLPMYWLKPLSEIWGDK